MTFNQNCGYCKKPIKNGLVAIEDGPDGKRYFHTTPHLLIAPSFNCFVFGHYGKNEIENFEVRNLGGFLEEIDLQLENSPRIEDAINTIMSELGGGGIFPFAAQTHDGIWTPFLTVQQISVRPEGYHAQTIYAIHPHAVFDQQSFPFGHTPKKFLDLRSNWYTINSEYNPNLTIDNGDKLKKELEKLI